MAYYPLKVKDGAGTTHTVGDPRINTEGAIPQSSINGLDTALAGKVDTTDSRLSDTRTPTDNSVTSAKIVDGSIVNADVNASAAIALSKLATGALPTGITVASANIVNGTIVDADVNASAAIAQSKISGLTSALAAKVTKTSSGTAPSSPATGDIWYDTGSTPPAAKFWDGSAWQSFSAGAAVISGTPTGTFTDAGIDYAYYTFTASGTLTVTEAGFADVLVVGAGGGGGSHYGGGGGAGGYVAVSDAYISAGSVSVVIGAGGSGGASYQKGINGGASYVWPFVAPGGAGGGEDSQNGNNGPSGSGGSYYMTGGTGTAGIGNNGGNGAQGGGGGGGANAAGSNGLSNAGGAGGAGTSSSITGSAVTRAGGGGGGINAGAGDGGAGGTGGGGKGQGSTAGSAGTANTGGGGGGGTNSGGAGFAGGSGIVIVRVKV